MIISAILILWTWGLTPTWVNITATILLGLKLLFKAMDDKNE